MGFIFNTYFIYHHYSVYFTVFYLNNILLLVKIISFILFYFIKILLFY